MRRRTPVGSAFVAPAPCGLPKWMRALDSFGRSGSPVVLSFAMGERSRELLDAMKDWLARNNAVIMAVLLLVIGVKLIGDAISGFSG